MSEIVFTLNSEIVLPKDAPVRLLSAQLEELDYEKWYRAYSPKGRKSAADPRVLFKVLAHGYLCGIYSSRKLEEACRYRISTDRGIRLRLCRSIQAEGAFALLKQDFGFRRFLTRGRANVRTELFLLALVFNLKKLWRKREHGRLQVCVSEKLTA